MISNLPWSFKALLLVFTQLFAAYWGIRAFEGDWKATELVLGAVLGYAFLDFMTVLTHYIIDNYFRSRTPLIGSVVHYFREHHSLPDKMFERGYVDSNFEQCFIALPFLLGALVVETTALLRMFVAVGAFAACYITQIHKWAHQAAPPWGARVLQRAHIIVDARYHRGHHELLDRNYALCAGWVDRPLAWLRVLAVVETVVYLLSGHTPINQGPNLAEAGKTTFSERLARVGWNIWYRSLAWYAERRGARFYCMNWGYEDGAALVPSSREERYSLQLYERAVQGIPLEGKRLVEVSSGRGGGLGYLAETKELGSAVGIDLIPENVRVSREAFAGKIRGLHYQKGEAQATGLATGEADVALSIEASHCYPNFRAFLTEAHRVLAEGGFLVLADFRPAHEMDRLRADCLSSGFEISFEGDIAGAVLEAMRRDAPRRRALIANHSNPVFRRLLRHFAAADESAATYQRLLDRSYVYFLLQMRRR